MTAKISDPRQLKVIEGSMISRLGVMSFMPQEAVTNTARYGTCIDCFSYGIVMIHIFSGRWPEPQHREIRTEPGGGLFQVSEAERRDVFLQDIGKFNDHPLMDLILKCINNDPLKRPCASEIVEQLAQLVFQFPTYANQLEMMR